MVPGHDQIITLLSLLSKLSARILNFQIMLIGKVFFVECLLHKSMELKTNKLQLSHQIPKESFASVIESMNDHVKATL